ncbi:MAG: hypothetical protein ABL308_10885 [Oceanicaulis sp.]
MYDHSLQDPSVTPESVRTGKLREILARRGFVSSSEADDIAEALALGESALGGGLVPQNVVQACENRTGRCFFIRRAETGEAEGFIALLYLNKAGYEALMWGRFRPEAPDLDHLTVPGERATAIYVWCLAGSTDEARFACVRAVTEARRKAFPDIALFARPMSREGRMMTAALDAPGAGAAWLGWVPVQSGEEEG